MSTQFMDAPDLKFFPEQIYKESFADCFRRIGNDENFAWKCLLLALLSRNEDLVRILLDHLYVTR